MPIHSDPNNMNSIVYHLIIVKYSMKTLHWYFPWATALHLYNMTGTGGKLQQLHCYHPFSDSLDIYLNKNHSENYSPKMVPIAKIWGSGSWTILSSMVSHQRVIVGLSQSAPAVGWGSPLHAWLASVNWIGGARCLNRRYRYGARGMHYHILLRQYSQSCYH